MDRSSFTEMKISGGLLLYGYAVALGATYLFSLWRPLGFNIFPYMSATDLLTVPFNRLSVLLAPILLLAALPLGEHLVGDKIRRDKLLRVVVSLSLSLAALDYAQSLLIIARQGAVFENEKSIFVVLALFLMMAVAFCLRFFRSAGAPMHAAACIVLCQLVLASTNGYKDGKFLYYGAMPARYLQQKEMCSPPNYGQWVYLDKYGENVFFMNTLDKRLCVLDTLRFNLVDRRVAERLAQ
jgi:hypothetical protein